MAIVPGKRLTREEVEEANRKFETAPPQELLQWALSSFGRTISLAWSGAEDVAVLDMMHRIDPRSARAFVLDTGRLNPETYELIDEVQARYKIPIDIQFPDSEAVRRMVESKGINLFYRSLENRKECCSVRKVQPLNRVLKTLDGWITGQRRSQAVTRGKLAKVEIDFPHDKIVKLNPLADWSTAQVFDYLKANDVPTNKLHAMGYPSIGCGPCTRAVKPGEDERAGRWWWEDPKSKECGLHPTP